MEGILPFFLMGHLGAPYCLLLWKAHGAMGEWEQLRGFKSIKQYDTALFFLRLVEEQNFCIWEAALFPVSMVLQSTQNYHFQLVFRVTCVCKHSHSLSLAYIDRKLVFLKEKEKRSCVCHSILSIKFSLAKNFHMYPYCAWCANLIHYLQQMVSVQNWYNF